MCAARTARQAARAHATVSLPRASYAPWATEQLGPLASVSGLTWLGRMCPQCACAVKVHLTSGWKSRPRRKSSPSVAIWRGRRVTGGLEAQRQKASKEVEQARRPQRE